MNLRGVETWLKAPSDHEVISRWTVGRDQNMSYALQLPPPADPQHFKFLVLGDTGNADAAGPNVSPQDAVAQEMAKDARLPETSGPSEFVIHVGDVVYMTGEKRLYDRNFRTPYAPFITPNSTVENLVFRLPFLPVPGNHDYYDLGGWAGWLSKVPILGAGFRAVIHELFSFTFPEGGSDQGQAYMQAFIDPKADTAQTPLPYVPGERTRLPNRYYRFQYGTVDFFALDSNTLEAPPPWTDVEQAKLEAEQRIEALEARARQIDEELRGEQLTLERFREAQKRQTAADVEKIALIRQEISSLTEVQEKLLNVLASLDTSQETGDCAPALQSVSEARGEWLQAIEEFDRAGSDDERLSALQSLDHASDSVCASLSEVEKCLAATPERPFKTLLLSARDEAEKGLKRWSETVQPSPIEINANLHRLSEDALDVQRELALEKRRARYQPEDYDKAQLEWLQASLEESIKARPDNWRVVYLHHPLYSTIRNHCERADIQGVRENLLPLLRERVHLVLSGHSHAFEWFRSSEMPNAGLFVTGGGGQITLRPSLLESELTERRWKRYRSLVSAGAQETIVAGHGPAASDGESGSLYHYLQIEVSPDSLKVTPIGVRRLPSNYRRESPMPVHHAPLLAESGAFLRVQSLDHVEIRRNAPPIVHWAR